MDAQGNIIGDDIRAQTRTVLERIAQSLWMGYQMRNGGDDLPTPLEAPRHG